MSLARALCLTCLCVLSAFAGACDETAGPTSDGSTTYPPPQSDAATGGGDGAGPGTSGGDSGVQPPSTDAGPLSDAGSLADGGGEDAAPAADAAADTGTARPDGGDDDTDGGDGALPDAAPSEGGSVDGAVPDGAVPDGAAPDGNVDGGISDAGSCDPCPVSFEQIEVGDLVFDARVAGPAAGEPVILLHGFPQMSLEWAAQIDALSAAGYRVVAPDQRGYSDTARPEEVSDYQAEVLARDVFDIADALGFEKFHLVGHDWGGVIGWHAAGLEPERLATYTSVSVAHPDEMAKQLRDTSSCRYRSSSYVDTFASSLGETSLMAVNAAGMRVVFGDLPTADEYIEFFQSNEDRVTGGLNWYRANFEDRQYTAPEVGTISVPTMFLFGEFETDCDQMPENTANYVTGPYQFEIIEGSDHWIPERAPEQVNPLLLAHFRAYPAR